MTGDPHQSYAAFRGLYGVELAHVYDELQAKLAAVERERDELREALRELVDLKDGPRDADYERRKPLAWQAGRDALKERP